MHDPEPFGRWLQRRREALDLTRDEMARRVGCAEVTIRKIERGERRPSRQIAALIAGQLDLTPTEREAFVRRARAVPALVPTDNGPDEEETPQPAPPRPAPRLPLPATPLLGRSEVLAELRNRLLHSDVRLLTIVGLPGVGKTRVALQLAASLGDDFADGVRFAGLVPVSDPALAPAAIAQALELNEPADVPPLQRLIAYLRERQLLLVIDNFEQVADAAPRLAELLAAAPRLKLLVTSRVLLRLSGEHSYALTPLELPDSAAPLTALAESPAVALFVQRAQATQADFALTSANAAAVAEICARLEGLPLAIELAAAWTRVLTPAEIAQEARRGLDILSGGLRDVPERQRSLRAVLDHSWNLLSEPERHTLRRLAVLPGAFGRVAAEQVSGASLPVIAALIDHSLLRRDAPGRFDMHPLVRQYAADQLAASDDQTVAHAGLAAYAVALAEEAWRQIKTGDQQTWIARLEAEHETLRAALAVAAPADELRLVAALWEFWMIRGFIREGRERLRRTVDNNTAAPPSTALALLLCGAGAINMYNGDPRVMFYFERAAAMARDLNNLELLCEILLSQVYEVVNLNDGVRARAIIAEASGIARQLGDQRRLAATLASLGEVIDVLEGGGPEARAYFEESLAIYRELGDQLGVIWRAKRIGDLCAAGGDFGAARAYYDEALTRSLAIGERNGEAWTLVALASVADMCSDNIEVIRLGEAAHAIFVEIEDLGGVAWALNRLGWAYWRMGSLERAEASFRASQTVYSGPLCAPPGGLAWNLSGLGHIAWSRGDLTLAEERLRESLEIFRSRPNDFDLAFTLGTLGKLLARRGAPEQARPLLAEAVEIARRRGFRWLLTLAQEAQAELEANDDSGDRN